MSDERRRIVELVARGQLSPEEAAARLEQLEPAALPPPSPGATLPPPASSAPMEPGVKRVRIELEVGTVRVYGDASVAGAAAAGPHVAKRDGDTLVIRSTGDDDAEGFVFGRRGFSARIGGRAIKRVDVRMNPRLALDLKVQAGEVRVEGVEGPIDGQLQAGSIRMEGFRQPITMNVQAGQVRGRGRLDSGTSRIRCEAGSVRLELERGSSVKVRARSVLGPVTVDGDQVVMVGGGTREMQIGSGAGTLEIDSSLGEVRVDSDR